MRPLAMMEMLEDSVKSSRNPYSLEASAACSGSVTKTKTNCPKTNEQLPNLACAGDTEWASPMKLTIQSTLRPLEEGWLTCPWKTCVILIQASQKESKVRTWHCPCHKLFLYAMRKSSRYDPNIPTSFALCISGSVGSASKLKASLAPATQPMALLRHLRDSGPGATRRLSVHSGPYGALVLTPIWNPSQPFTTPLLTPYKIRALLQIPWKKARADSKGPKGFSSWIVDMRPWPALPPKPPLHAPAAGQRGEGGP